MAEGTATGSGSRLRKSIRLQHYDYSQPGAYFVTICTQGRRSLLGEIVDNSLIVNEYGMIVHEAWDWLSRQYAHVTLDAFVVMPNHLHGIICLSCVGEEISRDMSAAVSKRKTLGQVVGAFKTVSTKHINEARKTPGRRLWQRNFYEHIIRDAYDLENLRTYIVNNPAAWILGPRSI